MRGVADMNVLDRFCTSFCEVVDRYAEYIIVSGFVAISSGRTRATEDIDMIITRLSLDAFQALHGALERAGFVCVQSGRARTVYEYLDHGDAIRYTWKDKPLPEMEVKFAKDALDEEQLKTRTKLSLTGIDVWFSTIEANVAFKEEYLKSDKDLKDAEHLRKVYDVDEREVGRVKMLIRRYRL